MRALFKDLMKGSGTPVLQTLGPGGETILSAGNIWTSAHARRIALRERGLRPGDVLASEAGGLAALVDFVAATIGGFVYLPLAPDAFAALCREIVVNPVPCEAGIMLVDRRGGCALHPFALPQRLAMIAGPAPCQLALASPEPGDPLARVQAFTAAQIEDWLAELCASLCPPPGGSRLSCGACHHDIGFVVDLLLAVCNRQTIYLRSAPAAMAPERVIAELLGLGVDDLVMPPAMLGAVARAARRADPATRSALAGIRAHTGGRALLPGQRARLSAVFGQIFVEPVPAGAAVWSSPSARHLVPLF